MLDWLAAGLERLGPYKETAFTQSVREGYHSSWFLSPQQHVVEMSIVLAVVATALVQVWEPARKERKALGVLDTTKTCVLPFLGCCAYISVFFVVYYKVVDGDIWRATYLVQPCHVLDLVFALCLTILPHCISNYVFQVATAISWSSVLAMLFPDTSDYTQNGEFVVYWVEHTLLLLIPYMAIYTGAFEFATSRSWMVLTFVLFLLYHFWFLAPLALYTEVNLATITFPRPPLAQFGKSYRMLQSVFSFLIHWAYHEALCLLVKLQGKRAKVE